MNTQKVFVNVPLEPAMSTKNNFSTDRPAAKGRGTRLNPRNRFEQIEVVDDFEQLGPDDDYLENLEKVPTQYYVDTSKSIISENDTPDLSMRYHLNPYRGCVHGCSYCYARPYHEYLGLNSGLDFETKIFVKEDAARLFRDWLCRPKWQSEVIGMSGITDCYQPAEKQFRITRQCLEVALEARQPMGIITKNALVTRDLDLLTEMAKFDIVSVAVSLTSLDQELTKVMEPRTSAPTARLRAIRELTQAGIPTHVMVAPIIPGLNDSEIPAILEAASEAGARSAGHTVVRLPYAVKEIFQEWLQRARPEHGDRILSRIRSVRDGKLTDSTFGRRMRGQGEIAEQIHQTFDVFARRYGLNERFSPLSVSHFRQPQMSSGQMWLF